MSNYRVISGPYFPVLGLNMEIKGVNLAIQSECRKVRTRNNSVFGHFSCTMYNYNIKNFVNVPILTLFDFQSSSKLRIDLY